jgi:hypothetical protein
MLQQIFLVSISLIALLMSPRDVAAQCPVVDFRTFATYAGPRAVIFHGRVRDVMRAPLITFDVDRAWRGDVTRRFSLFHPFQGTGISVSEGLPKFEVGRSYLVFADFVENDPTRKIDGPPIAGGASGLVADPCATRPASLEMAMRGGDKGHAPRR